MKHCTGASPWERGLPGLELEGQPRDFGHYEELQQNGCVPEAQAESSEDGGGSNGSDAAESLPS